MPSVWVVALVVGVLACCVQAQAASLQDDTLDWAKRTFAGTASPAKPVTEPMLTLRRQDHGKLGLKKSVIDTPLCIGTRKFEHGLGSHSNSEIVVDLPAGQAKSFSAMVGVDNNPDTGGERGTVRFAVEVGGKEVLRTDVLKSGQEPMEVKIEIPPDAKQLILKVDDGGDGPQHDHADWADAKLAMVDGRTLWLEELKREAGPFMPGGTTPFSFIYDGKSSSVLLGQWKRTTQSKELPDRVEHVVQWIDPKTGLKVSAEAKVWKDFPAVEWLLRFENTGTEDSPILENAQVLDLMLGTSAESPVVLDQIRGDDCSANSFVPMLRELKANEISAFAPNGGRSSNGSFPFYNVDCAGQGMIVGIGWTGQWAASVAHHGHGPTQLRAGMELTHLKLLPGESIRTPRILLMRWTGERIDAHNQFRRLILAHYLPKLDGKSIVPCIGAQTFNRWASGAQPRWGTEAGQIEAAKIEKKIGCDTHWLDAGWFEGYFPNGVGNWFCRAKDFPNGLKPVGEACEKLGLKFLVWYEPERVCPNTLFAGEHPEFVLGDVKNGWGGLFNLGDEKARRWMTDLILKQIDEFHIHTWRNDFNIDPLPFWRANDKPDRQGITEIRYVEGLYAMWDEFRAKHPAMYLDDCASGGRRIDLEMVMRSCVQTRSDTACMAGRADWDQSQTYGLSHYIPSHATIGWELGTYACRSSATAGYLGEWDILDKNFPMDQAKAAIAEIRQNQKYFYGDYYPLTKWTMDSDKWLAYQFHLPAEGEGIILAFRHSESPYTSIQVAPRGLKADGKYEVSFSDEDRKATTKTMTGKELATLELRIDKPMSSLLVTYKVAKAPR